MKLYLQYGDEIVDKVTSFSNLEQIEGSLITFAKPLKKPEISISVAPLNLKQYDKLMKKGAAI